MKNSVKRALYGIILVVVGVLTHNGYMTVEGLREPSSALSIETEDHQ